ncbi:MAG: cupin [Lautropia sp. SCN 66-9]|nr:MAG: cupin [Lautropia sp. SCN 66-9]
MATIPAPQLDQLAHWLVSALEWRTTVFHVGQYCGNWRASTHGHALASFHLVLRGRCHLHRPGQPPITLGPRDGVLLFRDTPHHLSPHADTSVSCAPRPMQPLEPAQTDGTALVCGFFQFNGALSELMIDALPDHVVIRSAGGLAQPVGYLFDLMLAEAAQQPELSSPLIERLTDLLFFYVLRHVAQDSASTGLWALAQQPALSALLEQLLREPGKDWSADEMARVVNMSRARFFRRFVEACGQAPAQFLLELRMHMAAQRLGSGDSVTRAAEHVGYHSYAAFCRAFKKVIGEQPGAYQRARRREHGLVRSH